MAAQVEAVSTRHREQVEAEAVDLAASLVERTVEWAESSVAPLAVEVGVTVGGEVGLAAESVVAECPVAAKEHEPRPPPA